MTTLLTSMTQQAAFDGMPANLVELSNHNGMVVTLMDIGATWLSCRLPVEDLDSGKTKRDVLLGVSSMQDFMAQRSYMGVTVGRFANRIANGQFDIGGGLVQVSVNQAGNCLHGGKAGFDKRRWQIKYQSAQQVTFLLLSQDGDQGFHGNLMIEATYTLTDDNQVQIEYVANTDKATPVNLTNHAYFNLSGTDSGRDCLLHHLTLDADYYLPTTDVGIPLGSLQPVEYTGFDFRRGKRISDDFLQDEQQQVAKGYDHSFWFDPTRDMTKAVAQVVSDDQKVRLSVFTNKPAMQLYTGNWLAGTPNRQGGEYFDYAGLALETQFLPDSPNHPEWGKPSCILRPDQEYRFFTRYHFEF